MSERRPEPDERDVLKTLTMLAGESRVYRMHLENAVTAIQRLSGDIDDPVVEMLWTSMVVALEQPARLGTPRAVEDAALRVLRDVVPR